MSLSALCASYASSSGSGESDDEESGTTKNDPRPSSDIHPDDPHLDPQKQPKSIKNDEKERPKNSPRVETTSSEKPNQKRPNFPEDGDNHRTKKAATGNFFDLGEGSTISSSSSDGENSDDDEDANDFDANGIESASRRPKLPSAMSVLSSSVSSSVFRNFYREAEDAEFDCLERHVKMTEQKRHVTDQLRQRPQRKSRAVCVQFKKGRCRYDADQCRFSHVIGQTLKARLTPADVGGGSGNDPRNATPQEEEPPPVSMYEGSAVRYNAREEIDEPSRPRKKRVGVSDTLQPPKKAMQLFDQERQSEAPWLYDDDN